MIRATRTSQPNALMSPLRRWPFALMPRHLSTTRQYHRQNNAPSWCVIRCNSSRISSGSCSWPTDHPEKIGLEKMKNILKQKNNPNSRLLSLSKSKPTPETPEPPTRDLYAVAIRQVSSAVVSVLAVHYSYG